MTSNDAVADFSQITVDLERKLAESVAQQAATSEILRVISQSPTDVKPVFDAIVLAAVRLFRCDLSFFLRCHGATFSQAALVGPDGSPIPLDPTVLPIDPEINFPSRTFVSRQNLHLPDWSAIDLPEHERGIHETYGINSSLFLPLLLRAGECVGLLALASKQPRVFDEGEIALAESFRDQAVIAIENTRLFNETQEALRRQTATADVLRIISRSVALAAPVFDTILESCQRLFNPFDAAVYLVEGNRVRGVARRGAGAGDWGTDSMPLEGSSTGAAIAQRRPIHFPDLADKADLPEDIRAVVKETGGMTVLYAPMISQDSGVGSLVVTRRPAKPFTEAEVGLIQTFADQAVIAIENARLFDEVQARTRELSESLQFQTASAEVLKVISRSPDDLQPVLDVIVETSRELCNALTSVIFLLRDGKFHHAADSIDESFRKPDYIDTFRGHPISLDQVGSALARATREKRTIHIPNSEEDPEAGRGGPLDLGGAKALLSVPLILDGSVIGGIMLRQSHLAPFTQRQIEAVESFADQAVIAISNVNLFEEVQQRTRELAKSLDDLRAAQDRLVQTEKLASLGQLTAGIAHEIRNPLNFVNNFAALSTELTDELNETLAPASLDQKMRGDVDELTGMLKSNLEKVVQHGKRADAIVKNMLLHSREGSGERQPAEVNKLVEESVNLAYHGARAENAGFTITLRHDLDPEAGALDLYPQEMIRALLNLISNGFYAATKRRTEASDETFEPVLSAVTRNLGDAIEIRIRDNGTGISPDVREKMFNPFFTTKPTGEGTGLGLSMTHDIIVKQHGGRIDVETEPGSFAEFIITLPRGNGAAIREKSK